MSEITTEILAIDGVNNKPKFPKFNSGSVITKEGTWYNVAKSVSIDSFRKGALTPVIVETNDKGYKTIKGFPKESVGVASKVAGAPVLIDNVPVVFVPSLPPTTLPETKAPGGEAPVRPAKRPNENGKTGVDDKMTKEDWANKDRAIELVAIVKSSIESPALANITQGRSEADTLEAVRNYVRFNLETLQMAKQGTL